MKSVIWILTTALLLTPALAWAQPGKGRPDRDPENRRYAERKLRKGSEDGPHSQRREKFREMRREQQERFKEWLAAEHPSTFQKWEKLDQNAPDLARQILQQNARFHGPRAMLHKSRGKKGDGGGRALVPELLNLELDSALLAVEYRKAAGEADRTRIRSELEPLLEKAFESRQTLQKKHIEAMRERLAKLEAMVVKRQENKEAVLQARLKKWTDPAQSLDG